MLPYKSFLAKTGEHKAEWILVDAADKTVGRLASDIAMALMGKHKPTYTAHVDTGDFVVVINCDKVILSGRKWDQKTYDWFTGYTRLRQVTARKQLEKHPERILSEAVRRMLPKNRLATKMLSKLKIYSGAEHPHQAQQPKLKEYGNPRGGRAKKAAAQA